MDGLFQIAKSCLIVCKTEIICYWLKKGNIQMNSNLLCLCSKRDNKYKIRIRTQLQCWLPFILQTHGTTMKLCFGHLGITCICNNHTFIKLKSVGSVRKLHGSKNHYLIYKQHWLQVAYCSKRLILCANVFMPLFRWMLGRNIIIRYCLWFKRMQISFFQHCRLSSDEYLESSLIFGC